MSVVRTCMYFLVLSMSFHSAVGKPLFGTWFWCELFCDDDDDVSTTSTTSTSTEDYFDDLFGSCDDCPTRSRRRPSTDRPNPNMAPLSFVIPPMTGMGVTVSNRNGTWLMNLSPWGSPSTTATPAAAATTAAATTAAATTAGTGGTTVAPTTTKK